MNVERLWELSEYAASVGDACRLAPRGVWADPRCWLAPDELEQLAALAELGLSVSQGCETLPDGGG